MKTFRTLLALAFVLAFSISALAVTTNDLRKGSGLVTGSTVVEKTIDFSDLPAGAGDIYKVFNIPQGSIVERVSLLVVDDCTSSALDTTIDVGDSGDSDGYLDGVSNGTDDTLFSSYTSATNQGAMTAFHFYDEDVAASQSAAAWGTQPAADVGGALKAVVMPFSGSVVGVSVYTATAHTTGTITADPTIAGTATGLQASAAAGVATGYASQAPGLDTFAAGQAIGVKVTTLSTFAATTTDWRATVFVAPDTVAFSKGKKYAAADYLQLTAIGAITDGKVIVRMELKNQPRE